MNIEKVKLIFTKANEFKEGDLQVGGTLEEIERVEAKKEVAAMKIGDISKLVFVEDEITEAIKRSINRNLLNEISHLTIYEIKEILLGSNKTAWVKKYSEGLTSEVISAIVKIMSNDELSILANSIFNPLPDKIQTGPVIIGSKNHFGSRIQPNSPGDDEEEILISILEGLSYGCGDVIIGLNPASDDIETIVRTEKLLQSIVERLKLPTRYSVLTDIIKQSTACSMTKIDVGFQSLAGTSKSLIGMVGLDIIGVNDLAKKFEGLYFETGQGSEVTNGAAEGVDMVTLESRCYGAARYIRKQNNDKWMIVNDVAGFIGPEVFKTGAQLLRACLEDTVMAKLHGIMMGLDVCATFHMGINPFELNMLTEKIVEMASPGYLMSVAGKADPMLGILTTSFREHPRIRMKTNKQISSAMKNRLYSLGLISNEGEATGTPEKTAALYASYMKEGGDKRSVDNLKAEGRKKIFKLKEKGFDLGYGYGKGFSDPPEVSARLDLIYKHARKALYSMLDSSVIKDCCKNIIDISTLSADRDDYLAHPRSGEFISDKDTEKLKKLHQDKKPQVQIIISDGLNANAVNENLRKILPKLKFNLKEAGFNASGIDIVIKNGRVRAGYHAAQLICTDVIIHLIGERPGTGLNQLSAYLTYGRDQTGNFRWSPDMDHSFTTAICSIHNSGKNPDSAVEDMVKCVKRMVELKCSGVSLF